MEIVIATIILFYFFAWFLRGTIYVLYWTFNPISEWAYERVSESRYRTNSYAIILYFIAKPIDIIAHFYVWVIRTTKDHFGSYLLMSLIWSFLWYQTATSSNKDIYTYLFLALFTVLLFPTLFLNKIAEPLGLVRSSYYLGQLATYSYRHYHNSGAVFSAIIAWRRSKNTKHRNRQKKWIATKLLRCNPHEISTLICHMLIADDSRSEEQLIALLKAFYFIDPLLCPGRLYRKAGLLLLAIESQRGDWKAVKKWSSLWLKKAPSPEILFFYLVAQRMDYQPSPGNALFLLFTCVTCLNPAYISIAFLALGRTPKDIVTILDKIENERPDRQTGLHFLSTISQSNYLQTNKVILNRLGYYFEDILSGERATAATNNATERHISQIEEVVSTTLSEWYENAAPTADVLQLSTLISDASSKRENMLMESLNYHVQSLENRFRHDTYINTEFEWEEWASIMLLYELTTTTPHLHYLAFHTVSQIFWSWSVWLHNSQRERNLAYAIFRWIRNEALHFEDHETTIAMDQYLGRVCFRG